MSGYISSSFESAPRRSRRYSGLGDQSQVYPDSASQPCNSIVSGGNTSYRSTEENSFPFRERAQSEASASELLPPPHNEQGERISTHRTTGNSGHSDRQLTERLHTEAQSRLEVDIESGVSQNENAVEMRWPSNRIDPTFDSEAQFSDVGSNMLSEETSLYAFNESPDFDDKKKMSLPTDDGMTNVRRKIHAIRELAVPNLEKARLIHDIMTEGYYSSSKSYRQSQSMLQSSSSPQSEGRPCTPGSLCTHSFDQLSLTPPSPCSTGGSGNPYHLTHEDLKQTYYTESVITPHSQDGDVVIVPGGITTGNGTIADDSVELGCCHYKRNVKLQCYTCKRWYTCRFCHDDAEDHTLNRRKTQNMLCMVCSSPQTASQWCKTCGVQAACYYCAICKLWDNDAEKSIYHCNDCGICRLGQGIGKDFFHCKTCSVCMPISIQTTHRCIEQSTKCDCPICGEYMFTSPQTVIFMRCGHSIHQKCFLDHSRTSYRCPICNKSVTNMETNFRNLDRTIEGQPMPTEFKDTKALVYCNDCRAKSVVQYHWLGLKCDVCESYNTIQRQLLRGSTGLTNELEERPGFSPNSNRRIPTSDSEPVTDENWNLDGTGRSLPRSATPSYNRPHADSLDSQIRVPPYSSTYLPSSSVRSVSPIVTNYFGLSRQQDSEMIAPIPRPQQTVAGSEDSSVFSFWGNMNIKETFGLMGSSAGDTPDEDSGGDDERDDRWDDDTDEEEDSDSIDIFGHR